MIRVEVDCSGIKTDQDLFHTGGLPGAALRESRDRVRAVLKNCGYDIPLTQITINLPPSDRKKEGSGFDLSMALGILGLRRAEQERNYGLCFFRRVVPQRRNSRCAGHAAHCRRSLR
jgi:magnesium chelatase family protein